MSLTRFALPSLLPAAVALAAFWLSLAIGSVEVPVASGLLDFARQRESMAALVIGEVRLPRALIALLIGGMLGMAGAALQGLLRNPLADPGLIGASQGAALGAAAAFYFAALPGFALSGIALAPALAGLIGAALALLLMLSLADSGRAALLIMAGLAVSALCGALLAAVLSFAPNPFAMQELVFWLLGSVALRGVEYLWILLPAALLGGALIWCERPLLAGLNFGEQVAASLGLDCRRGARRIVLGVAMLVGAAVAVAGNVGFVGLLAPHLMRPWVGHRPQALLMPSAWAGAALVLLADVGTRLFPGREVHLGVVTALLGAPFFMILVWRERRQWLI